MEKYKEIVVTLEEQIKSGTIDKNCIMQIIEYYSNTESIDEKEYAACYIEDICERYNIRNDIKVLLISVILSFYKKEKYALGILNFIIQNEQYTWQNLFYLYNQILRMIFMNKEINTLDVSLKMNCLFELCVQKCINDLNYDFTRIPEEELNGSCQLVLTDQFLNVEHGPTKTALDRAAVIKKKYGNVLLVNTAEFMSSNGAVPYSGFAGANYFEEFLKYETVDWKGQEIGFFQCENNMPNPQTIVEILTVVKNMKPQIVVSVGGDSIVAALINKLVPTLVIGCTQSNLPNINCDFLVADPYQLELNKEYIEAVGCRDKIIEGLFTFSLKERSEFISRKDLGLTEQDFVISIVGGRLTEEVSDELLEMLDSIDNDFKIMLIGTYEKMDYLQERFPELYAKTYNAGFCNDAMSRIELSDLYLNPIRQGGGTSAVEAMSLGIPVVTYNYGDVAGIVGRDFVCDNMENVKSDIIRYMVDKDFYISQREKSLKLVTVLLDSEKEFTRILNEYISRRK